MDNVKALFEHCSRSLKDITDEELAVFVKLSGHFSSSTHWGEPVVTGVDRQLFDNTICVDFEQTRISDGEKSEHTLFFDYITLSYHTTMYEPFERATSITGVCARTKLFLWLVAQGFNVFEYLTEEPVVPLSGQKLNTVGFVVNHGFAAGVNMIEDAKFFSCDERREADKYAKENEMRVYQLVEKVQ